MRKKIKLTFNLSLISTVVLQSAFCATPINLKNKPITFFQPLLAAELKSPETTFEETTRHVDFKNRMHVRMQQKFQGYPVWGAHSIIHTSNQQSKKLNFRLLDKSKTTMTGWIYQNFSVDLRNIHPSQFETNEKEKALDYIKIYYQSKSKELVGFSRPKIELMVYVDEKNKAHWSYYIEFSAKSENQPRTKPVYIMDAVNYDIYESWNNLHTTEKTMVKGGGYGGNKKIGQIIYDGERGDAPPLSILRDKESGICFLQDNLISIKDTRHNNALVQYACSQPNEKHGNIYWNDANESEALGAYSPDNDVFYHASIAKNMYLYWYHTPALVNRDNTEKHIEINTHLNEANAMWDDDTKELYFGDGSSQFLPFTSLDIVSHELAHGFTMQHANLIYKGESGGLNEAFSDMAGVATGYFATGKSNWKVGSDITIREEALRFMDNPRHDCVGIKSDIEILGKKIRQCSIDHVKDFRAGFVEIGPFRLPLVDVHYSSGIFNKAFYLMAQGWGGDIHEGTRKAFDVMVQANLSYWTKNTTFFDAACGVMEATHDYGYDADVVVKAMAAVGIDTNKC